MSILVTGAAGFIGSHVCKTLLGRGEQVIAIDNLSSYYDVGLKNDRLARLASNPGFSFFRGDIAEEATFASLPRDEITHVIHLAAQAGVRYSIENPRAYVRSNVSGHLEVLEFCRRLSRLEHLVYSSSSSVYGNNKVPFSEDDVVDHPISIYAATKKSDELLSYSYSHLFHLPQTGLRFFTVYGPWGRPDMAYWIFTKAIIEGTPIRVFNNGDMWRDFTYVDDIVGGVLAVLDRPPGSAESFHRLYNIGNNRPEHLGKMIGTLEALIGTEAIKVFEDIQPGDLQSTCADITKISRDTGFVPKFSLEDGLERFVSWYRSYYGV